MRRRLQPLLRHVDDGIERALLRRAARAEGDGHELRLEQRELLTGGAQLVDAFLRFWREEFE